MLTPEVQELIARLEAAGFRFRPGASPAQIQRLEKAIGGALPAELAALYHHGNGMRPFDYGRLDEEEASSERFRLMSTREAADEHEDLEPCRVSIAGRRCFWTDDESNYAALYVEGPLA